MIDEILQSAGFVQGTTYRQATFLKPPSQPFAVYFDNEDTSGSSDFDCDVIEHDLRVELYSPEVPAADRERAIESALKSRGIHYDKTGRIWIQSERYYLTVYDFDYIEKE